MKSSQQSLRKDRRELSAVTEVLCAGYQAQSRDRVYRALGYIWPLRDRAVALEDPVAIADELKSLGIDSVTLTAALLSAPSCAELLPDEKLTEEFGERVQKLVANVRWLRSFRQGGLFASGADNSDEQAERLRRMLLSMVEDVRAMLVLMAQVVVRLKAQGVQGEDRHELARDTQMLYAPLANRLGIGQLKWQMEDLAFRAQHPDEYKRIARSLEETRIARERYVDAFVASLRDKLRQSGPSFTASFGGGLATAPVAPKIFGRAKHIFSIWKKMQRKQIDFSDVFDVRAVRVLVPEISDCYAVLGVVHGNWQHIPREFDDYIANPKENGYQSLHTAVLGDGGKPIEIQIRTQQMDDEAELGVAAHWRYKEGGALDDSLQRSINALRELLETESESGNLFDTVRSDFFSDRVFTFTPKGDIIDLPHGATPLDFAYQIHTQVGHRCRGARVNGCIVPLTYALQNGDRIEVLTAREPHPSRDWLNKDLGYLHGSRTRAKVRNWFAAQDLAQHLQDGRSIFERTCKRLNAHGVALEKLAKKLRCGSAEDLFAALGRGLISSAQLDGAIYQFEREDEEGGEKRAHLPSVRRSRARKNASAISVRGVGDLLTQIAQCCQPVPYDAIIGYITRGSGVTIHRSDCSNILSAKDSERRRLIEVEWGGSMEQVYAVALWVEAYHRHNLVRDITQVIGDQEVSITAIKMGEQKHQIVDINLTVELFDVAQLSLMMEKVRQVRNVVHVERRN